MLSFAMLLLKNDRAKRYHKSSFFNLQYSIPACPGWASPSGAEAFGVTLNLNRRTADGEENIESAKDYN
jgi:hypothetical protein